MELLKKVKNKVVSLRRAWNEAEPTISMSKIIELFSGKAYDEISDLGEITYFTCLKTLSESVGKMPVYLMDEDKRRIKNHSTNFLMQLSPNKIQTPTQMFTTLEYFRNHYGNAYAYISKTRDGTIDAIIPLNSLRVQIWIANDKEFFDRPYYYYYTEFKIFIGLTSARTDSKCDCETHGRFEQRKPRSFIEQIGRTSPR